MSFKNFEENIRIAKSQLKKIEVDLNVYIDGYHLFLFFHESISFAQKQYDEMFKHFQIGSSPILATDENTYAKLIFGQILNLENEIEEKYIASFNETNNSILLLDHHFISSKLFEKILDKNDVLKIISNSYRNRNKQPLSHYLEINTYIHFFSGDGIDDNSLVRILNSYLKNTSETSKIERISKYINFFKTKDISRYSDEQLKRINEFEKFKNSLMNFDTRYKNKKVSDNHVCTKTKYEDYKTKINDLISTLKESWKNEYKNNKM